MTDTRHHDERTWTITRQQLADAIPYVSPDDLATVEGIADAILSQLTPDCPGGCHEFYDEGKPCACTCHAIHLAGQEDGDTACGIPAPPEDIACYWRKVTCPDCVELIEKAGAARAAASSRGSAYAAPAGGDRP